MLTISRYKPSDLVSCFEISIMYIGNEVTPGLFLPIRAASEVSPACVAD